MIPKDVKLGDYLWHYEQDRGVRVVAIIPLGVKVLNEETHKICLAHDHDVCVIPPPPQEVMNMPSDVRRAYLERTYGQVSTTLGTPHIANLDKPSQEPKFVGTKFDSEKLRPSLLPIESLEVVTKVLMFGSAKYSDHNWKIVPNARARYIDAAMRHLMAVVREEENDAESGLSHVAHCICCLLFVLWFDIKEQK